MDIAVRDGTQWKLTVQFKDFTVSSSGSNQYPLHNGKPGVGPGDSPAFKTYLKAVETLLGGKTFR